MLGEPPRLCPPAANADDDATSNPSTAAHNKLIFVIGGVPLFCRKRLAFLIKPKDKSDFVRSGTVEYYPHGTRGPCGTSKKVAFFLRGVCKFKNFLRGDCAGAEPRVLAPYPPSTIPKPLSGSRWQDEGVGLAHGSSPAEYVAHRVPESRPR
jgi:hypothetical protein